MQGFREGGWMEAADAVEVEFGGSEFLGTFQGVSVVVGRPVGMTDGDWVQWKIGFVARLSHVGEVREPLSDEVLDEHGF